MEYHALVYRFHITVHMVKFPLVLKLFWITSIIMLVHILGTTLEPYYPAWLCHWVIRRMDAHKLTLDLVAMAHTSYTHAFEEQLSPLTPLLYII